MNSILSVGRARALLLTMALALIAADACADPALQALAKRHPRARVLVEVTFDAPFEARDMKLLQKLKLHPITPNRDVLIGRDRLIFDAQAGDTSELAAQKEKRVKTLRWIKTYPAAAHYKIYFQYMGKEAAPNLTFSVAMPRSAAGRKLTSVKPFVWPEARFRTATDAADNQFLTVNLADVRPEQEILFDFYAMYEYDSAAIVESSLAALGPTPMPKTWPEDVQPFLRPGFHIESNAPEIVEAAKELGASERLDVLARAVMAYVNRKIKYDYDKKERYFGGRYVYRDAWEMWQGPVATLKRGLGCCPDSAELKVALLRAAGIPARTAVHSGHLYAEVYVPDRGWLTDAPMYNIPVLRSPGADNCSYFLWKPPTPVRCVEWGGQVQPFGEIRPGMRVDQPH